jgi:Na+-transporting methylmalonyl-CoA/oxaloacetate decarboxylase gamma subunit
MIFRFAAILVIAGVFLCAAAQEQFSQYNVEVMLNSDPQTPDNGTDPYPTQFMPSFGYVLLVLVVLVAIIAGIGACAIYTAFKDKINKQIEHYVHQIELKANPRMSETQNDEEVTISFVSSDSIHEK